MDAGAVFPIKSLLYPMADRRARQKRQSETDFPAASQSIALILRNIPERRGATPGEKGRAKRTFP